MYGIRFTRSLHGYCYLPLFIFMFIYFRFKQIRSVSPVGPDCLRSSLFLHVSGINYYNTAELENFKHNRLGILHVYSTESVMLKNILLYTFSALYVGPRGVSYITVVLKTEWVFLYSCSTRAGREKVKNKVNSRQFYVKSDV